MENSINNTDLGFVVIDRLQLKSIWYEAISYEDACKNCPNSSRYTPALMDFNTNKIYEAVVYTSGKFTIGKQLN